MAAAAAPCQIGDIAWSIQHCCCRGGACIRERRCFTATRGLPGKDPLDLRQARHFIGVRRSHYGVWAHQRISFCHFAFQRDAKLGGISKRPHGRSSAGRRGGGAGEHLRRRRWATRRRR